MAYLYQKYCHFLRHDLSLSIYFDFIGQPAFSRCAAENGIIIGIINFLVYLKYKHRLMMI